MDRHDILINIGGADSPWYEMVESQIGCKGYSLDLTHPSGIVGRRIGTDATKTLFPDGFTAKISLHCAYETFKGDAGSRLISEGYGCPGTGHDIAGRYSIAVKLIINTCITAAEAYGDSGTTGAIAASAGNIIGSGQGIDRNHGIPVHGILAAC